MDIEKVIKKMSLKEKIEQLNQICLNDENVEEIKKILEEKCIGSLILANSSTAGNAEQNGLNVDCINELQKISMEKYGIPLLFGRDVIHGHHISLPIPLGLAATFNPDLVKAGYHEIAEEAKNEGVHWSFAPMLDVSRDPRWGRIIESFGEDPYLGSKMGEAVIRGFQGEGDRINIAACAKHYIGYGASEGGRDYHKAEISQYSLQNYYLEGFRGAVNADVATVMNSFNEISGEPTTSNKYLLTDVLRGQLGFEGFVVSDWGSIVQLLNQGVARDKKEAAELSLNAGIDMDMVDGCYLDNLEKSVKEGTVSLEAIDEAVRRILTIKKKMNLFSKPYFEPITYDVQMHRDMARKIEEEAIVLLKNNGILPLKNNINLCIMGDLIDDKRNVLGSWSLDCDTKETITIQDGLTNKCEKVFYMTPAYGIEHEAMVNCEAVIVVLGEDYKYTGESNSIARLEIDQRQKSIIKAAKKTGKPVIGIMTFGRPRALEELSNEFDALLWTWHGGSQTGNAVANVLFGDVSPSGKLPATIPRTTGQIPLYYNCPPSGRNVNGYYEKRRNYWDEYSTPAYPFGYGLSYAEFVYGNIYVSNNTISLDELKSGKCFEVQVKVKNNSDMIAKETIQCYIRDCFSSYTRPIKELKCFVKEEFQNNEEKIVAFQIGFNELAFYKPNGECIVEPGEFKIYVGTDCTTDNYTIVNVI